MSDPRQNRTDNLLSEADHVRIAQVIRANEKRTSGEIFAVLAKSSDDYIYVAAMLSALWSIFIGVGLALTFWWFDLAVPPVVLMGLIVMSLIIFLGFFHFFPKARLAFIPRSIGYRRASANAVRQFLAHGIHETQGRSGVLLFISIAERYAEVVADAGINEKVDQSEWNTMVATLTDHAASGQTADGFLKAVEQAGSLLAHHFPPVEGQSNDLEDKLVEI